MPPALPPQDDASQNDLPQPLSSATPVHRAKSKVGRLSKATRDKLNLMIRDGIPYEDILPKLAPEAHGITARNISGWQASPHYRRWELDQDWLENLHADQEPAFDLLKNFDAPRFSQAGLQLAVTRLFVAFRHIDSGDLNHKLGGDAQTFARLVHALARASHETITIEKYREACARTIAAELKQLNVDRELSDREYELLVKKMDQVFRFARRRPTTPVASTPPANGSSTPTQMPANGH